MLLVARIPVYLGGASKESGTVMKSFLTWASSIIFLALIVWTLYIFSHDRMMGFPDVPEKNVSLVPSAPPAGDLALTLQPPMETRQMAGESQKLALQFSNRSKKNQIEVLPVRAEPSECFTVKPAGPNAEETNTVLKAGETSVRMDELSFSAKCVGEEHPMTLIYSWKAVPPPPPPPPKKKKSQKKSPVTAPPPHIEERSISTTPIRITSKELNFKERFVRIGQLVLLPVLLAIVTFIFQRHQAARDEAQNAETLKIEVWKTVQPSFLTMVKQYYSPILRRMVAIRGEITEGTEEDLLVLKGTKEDLLVLMLLLRRQMLLLLEKDAGYYFQSKPGEELVGLLNDPMVNHWRKELPRFDQTALYLQGNETLQAATRILQNAGVNLPTASQFLDPAKGNLTFFNKSLELFSIVMAFELDRPFYPVWYEREFPPKVSKDDMESLNGDNVSWYPENDKETARKELRNALREYRRSIPWNCVADKSWASRLRRIRDRLSG